MNYISFKVSIDPSVIRKHNKPINVFVFFFFCSYFNADQMYASYTCSSSMIAVFILSPRAYSIHASCILMYGTGYSAWFIDVKNVSSPLPPNEFPQTVHVFFRMMFGTFFSFYSL